MLRKKAEEIKEDLENKGLEYPKNLTINHVQSSDMNKKEEEKDEGKGNSILQEYKAKCENLEKMVKPEYFSSFAHKREKHKTKK